MKTNESIFKRMSRVLAVLLVLFTVSCSVVDDDEEEVPEGPTELQFQVDLVKMYATIIREAEGDRLETSGSIRAGVYSNTDVLQEYETLWNKYTTDPELVTVEDLTLGSRATFTVDSDYQDYSYFSMFGSMTEVDSSAGNPNEFMGEVNVVVDLLSVTGTQEFTLKFEESSDQVVEVVYSITRL